MFAYLNGFHVRHARDYQFPHLLGDVDVVRAVVPAVALLIGVVVPVLVSVVVPVVALLIASTF